MGAASNSLVVVGAGMAAARLVEELSTRALGRWNVALVGAEPRPAYNRVLLSSLLAGDIADEGVELRPRGWWGAKGVTRIEGRSVSRIDLAAGCVALEGGGELPFARLVLATGSNAIRLPIPGANLPGVATFRDWGDVDLLRAAARPGARAVVVGGGLLGLEAAYGLAKGGAAVTLVHVMDRLMERQLDRVAAGYLRRAVERAGVRVLLGAQSLRVAGAERAEALELADGRVLPADLVVMAVGVRPNAELARAAGIEVNRGVLVDDGLTTSHPAVSAIGECAEHRGVAYGLVEPAHDQARTLAARLAGDEGAAYAGNVVGTNLKVSGVRVFSAGEVADDAPGTTSLTYEDPGLDLYRRLVLREGRLVGAVLYGETADGPWLQGLMTTRADVSRARGTLAFGRAFVREGEITVPDSEGRMAA